MVLEGKVGIPGDERAIMLRVRNFSYRVKGAA
jgi:hypothetical protein